MKVMKYCLSPNKLAWLRQELGEHADGMIAAMDAAGGAYLAQVIASDTLLTEPSPVKTKILQLKFAWFKQKLALSTRLDDNELTQLAPFALDGAKVVLVQPEEMAAVLQTLSRESVLGFDTETRASFQANVTHPLSLIQIATHDACYLFQHALLGQQLVLLKSLLEDEAILKVGIGLRSDAQVLRREWGINVIPRLDLNWAMAQLGAGKEMGTRQLVAALLQRHIPKSKKVTLSNWQQLPLSNTQINYAALDALAAQHCFFQLIALLKPFYWAGVEVQEPLVSPHLTARLSQYFEPTNGLG